jgi:hypothetical protein
MYPRGEVYWPPFLESVAAQQDKEFVLWIGVDGLDPDKVISFVQEYVSVPVRISEGDSPVAVRTNALRDIVEQHDTVVLVDSDDILLPDRVRSGRAAIERAEVVGCALRLIDDRGCHLRGTLCPPEVGDAATLLPLVNVYGFSNTTYRSGVLRRSLPRTGDAELMDWYVATNAWLLGAQMIFDPEPHMLYRQYDKNTAGVLGPFTAERIRCDLPRVLRHYELILGTDLSGFIPERWHALEEAHTRLTEYWDRAQQRPELLTAHVQALNFENRIPMWWEWVTAPTCTDHTTSS